MTPHSRPTPGSILSSLRFLALGLGILYAGANSLHFLGEPQHRWQVRAPLSFHGRVMDQSGAPVADALIAYSTYADPATDRSPTSPRGDSRLLRTDGNGRFAIADKGAYLVIHEIRKPGYRFAPWSRMYVYRNSKYSDLAVHVDDPGQPVSFEAWKLGQTDPLLESGREYRTLPMDGESRLLPMAELEQGLRVAFTPLGSTGPDGRPRRRWRAVVTVDGGGLAEPDGHFMFEAPADGYVPELSFEGDEQARVEKRLYFRTADGSTYGRVRIAFRGYYGNGDDNDKGFVDYAYAVNPVGDRNLQPPVTQHFSEWEQ